jgi:glutathione S-transferase
MITLASFGPAFGLTDPSPFVTKVEILLRMAGADYMKDASFGAFRRAPKGKLPYIIDDGVSLADSTFIRLYLERKLGIDFDEGLTPAQRASGWAFEKLAEDHLYWATVYSRWIDERNFPILKAHLLTKIPPVLAPLLVAHARRSVRRHLASQGMGRHSEEEIYELGRRDLVAIADALGDRRFFFGAEPKAVDAALGALVVGILCEAFDSPLRKTAAELANLVAYRERIVSRFLQPAQAGRAAA